jgi:hypothetical protein
MSGAGSTLRALLVALLRVLAVAGLVLGAGLSSAQAPPAQKPAARAPKVDAEADRILRAMSRFLGAQQAFSMKYEVDNEVISVDGEKLMFSASGTLALQRPGKLKATRQGGFANAELFFDGQTVTLLGKNANAYFQLNGPKTIDEAIEALRSQADLDVGGADLLYADPAEGLLTDVVSGAYLGPAVVDGITCDHLAFRAAKVDWQLWVQRGDQPLPVKYVITSKWVTGAPQYAVRLHDWNLKPKLDPQQFVFKAPAGVKRVDALATNELGELSPGGAAP